jgi:hypothetical protein
MKERAMTKENRNSHDETDGTRDFADANERFGQSSDDADADPDLMWEADAEFGKALSRLRAVREPGKGKLSLQEAMKVASDQYEVYRAWIDKGGPLGRLKAWVEGKEVFDGMAPPVFESFHFNWPPLDEGVLQITTEYDGQQVVLYNLPLQDVPSGRSVHKELLPNGHYLVLTITRHVALMAVAGVGGRSSQTEKFSINIAIQSQAAVVESELIDLKRAAGMQNDTKNVISRPPISKPSGAIAYSVLIALLALMFILDRSAKSLQTSSVVPGGMSTGQKELQTPNPEPLTLQAKNDSLTETLITELKSSPDSLPANATRLNHVQGLSNRVSLQTNSADMKIAAFEYAKAVTLANTAAENTASYRALEESLAAFAELQQVSVRVKNSEMRQTRQAELVRVFAEAFQNSSRFTVLKDSDKSKAELVVGLRFEPTERTSGYVVVDIRDANGKFLWAELANCTESRPPAAGGTFVAAAGNLVSSLEGVMGTK